MLVRSFIGFGQSGNEGYVEFFTDVNDSWQQLRMLQWTMCGIVAGLSLHSGS